MQMWRLGETGRIPRCNEPIVDEHDGQTGHAVRGRRVVGVVEDVKGENVQSGQDPGSNTWQ